jgi:hypothetical protein
MIQLFSFVKCLEEDFEAVMRGVSIEYGSQWKGEIDVAQSMGWEKARKRAPKATTESRAKKIRHESTNNGWAPDTTETLLDTAPQKKKAGRPPGATNIDCNIYSTYPSYHALDKELLRNRCWMAASLESLYALFSPLWLRGSSGKGTSMFTMLVKHFTSRVTYEFTETGSIRKMLAANQRSMFQVANTKFPDSFIPGKYASADFFIEILLDPKANKNRSLKRLFEYEEVRQLTCKHHCEATEDTCQTLYIIMIGKNTFDDNHISYTDVLSLLKLWAGEGLQCKLCAGAGISTAPGKFIRANSTIKVADPKSQSNNPCSFPLKSKSTIVFVDNKAPPHLYFHLEVTSIMSLAEQQVFMAAVDWPFAISIHNQRYLLFARGYWNGAHFWCKVVRNTRNKDGVWLHNDMINDRYARLSSENPRDIGGAEAHTSWLMYSRAWTAEEKVFVEEKITQIVEDHPQATGQVPFAKMSALLETPEELSLRPSLNAENPINLTMNDMEMVDDFLADEALSESSK